MTDDGQQNDCGGIWEAGYLAAMEAAKKNYDDLRAGDWSYKSSWEVHGEWLDEQVKKEGA